MQSTTRKILFAGIYTLFISLVTIEGAYLIMNHSKGKYFDFSVIYFALPMWIYLFYLHYRRIKFSS